MHHRTLSFIFGFSATLMATACAEPPQQTDDEDTASETDTDTAAPAPNGCVDVQRIMNTSCTSCHGVDAVDGLDLRNITNALDIIHPESGLALIEPGDAKHSYFIHKLNDTHLTVGGTGMPMPPSGSLEQADIERLTQWVNAGATCDEIPEFDDATYDPNTLDQETLFTCDGTPSSSPARLRRIDRREFMHRTGHPLEHDTKAAPFEAPGHLPYSSFSEAVTVDTATLDLYFNVLSYAGDKWEGKHSYNRGAWDARYNASVVCIYDSGTPDALCVEEFVEEYLMRGVLHTLPEAGEVERLTAFAIETLADEGSHSGARDESIEHISAAAWLHTNALFDAEMGQDDADLYGRHRLTDWEAASMLTDMVSNLGPGATGTFVYANEGESRFTAEDEGHFPGVVRAAMDGSIQEPDVAKRLLRDNAMGIDPDRNDEAINHGGHGLNFRRKRGKYWMSDKIDQFFLEYFDVQSFPSGFQDTPNATSKYDAESALYYQRALDNMREWFGWTDPDGLMLFTDAVAKVVAEDTEVLQGLLTTRDFYLRANDERKPTEPNYSARLFGYEGWVDATQEGRWVTFPESQRKGLLTHPVWLASHGDAFEDGPSAIHRGKWVREHLLCETVPSLQLVTVDAQLIPPADHLRARDRIQQSTENNAECMTCHQFMNDLGYPFETFNHAGVLRANDHGFAPDGSTIVRNAPDASLNRAYATTNEFIDALADSNYVKRCFIRHTFRYFAGRNETTADACVLNAMEQSYDESGGSFISMLETLVTHDAMMYRTRENTP